MANITINPFPRDGNASPHLRQRSDRSKLGEMKLGTSEVKIEVPERASEIATALARWCQRNPHLVSAARQGAQKSRARSEAIPDDFALNVPGRIPTRNRLGEARSGASSFPRMGRRHPDCSEWMGGSRGSRAPRARSALPGSSHAWRAVVTGGSCIRSRSPREATSITSSWGTTVWSSSTRSVTLGPRSASARPMSTSTGQGRITSPRSGAKPGRRRASSRPPAGSRSRQSPALHRSTQPVGRRDQVLREPRGRAHRDELEPAPRAVGRGTRSR